MERVIAEVVSTDDSKSFLRFSKSFWVIWTIELWERFGYFGVSSILTIYFVRQLGFSESKSFYVFGSFVALAYGFIWIGGWVGDKYLGAKRTMVLGAILLMLSYASLVVSTHQTVFYSLAGIIVGTALFKANPSSLISKLYTKNDSGLDGAMTLYYMAVNIGSMLAITLTPVISQQYGWSSAFWISTIGLFIGLLNYMIYRRYLDSLNTPADIIPLKISRLIITIVCSMAAIIIIANLLNHTKICNLIIYSVVTVAFIVYLKLTLKFRMIERIRMLVALILILQGVLFFVLYNQMPTSLTFFALHNINNHLMGLTIPAAEYQALNPIVIVIMSPILAWVYTKFSATHVTKFCIGMSLCSMGFLILAFSKYAATNNLISPVWMVATYFFQSTGELLISGLGLAMVAELCPEERSGYVMGIWWLTCMLSGPIGAWVGSLTTVTAVKTINYSLADSLTIYTAVFKEIGIVTAVIALLMWLMRPFLNNLLKFNLNKSLTVSNF